MSKKEKFCACYTFEKSLKYDKFILKLQKVWRKSKFIIIKIYNNQYVSTNNMKTKIITMILVTAIFSSCSKTKFTVTKTQAVNINEKATPYISKEVLGSEGPYKSIGSSQSNPNKAIKLETKLNGELFEKTLPSLPDKYYTIETFINEKKEKFWVIRTHQEKY